jgi:deferrochelatase/peroxidase EfeB
MTRLKSAMQEGIYFRHGETPPGFFSLVLLRTADPSESADAAPVADVLERLWAMYAGLKLGRIRDLPGIQMPTGNLAVLLGWSQRAFSLTSLKAKAPMAFADGDFDPPDGDSNPIVKGSGIKYAAAVGKPPTEDDPVPRTDFHFAVQFTADTPLAVERAVVETQKLLDDDGVDAALQLAGVFAGTQRDDGRSWIDFHDGLSNLSGAQRAEAIAIPRGNSVPRADHWTVNGTYLAFVRVVIDLQLWRQLDDRTQEKLVGRDKLNGCPLLSSGEPAAGCPVAGKPIWASDNRFRNAPRLRSSVTPMQQAHIHRVRQDPGRRRIYRQGYPFLETVADAPGFRVGLNFVSFQANPETVIQILTDPSWLGDANFGGAPEYSDDAVPLLEARAAGMFLVPPLLAAEPFPGAHLF